MKVIGQAIARELGQYPVSPAGACALIEPGERFDVYDLHGVPAWADEVVEKVEPPPPPAKPPKLPKSSKEPAPPTADEIA